MTTQNTNLAIHRALETEEQLVAVRVPEGPMPDSVKSIRRPTLEEQTKQAESNPKYANSKRRKIISSITDEDENERVNLSLSYVLTGSMLNARWFRKQVAWMLMVACFTFMYITISYMTQNQMIYNQDLKEELKKSMQKVKVSESQLAQNHRQSTIFRQLAQQGDTTFKVPEVQPISISK